MRVIKHEIQISDMRAGCVPIGSFQRVEIMDISMYTKDEPIIIVRHFFKQQQKI